MMPPVDVKELAARLGIDDKRLRTWLRQQAADGHELLRTHQHRAGWIFTSAEADQLAADYRRGRATRGAWASRRDVSATVAAVLGDARPAQVEPASDTAPSTFGAAPWSSAGAAQVTAALTEPPARAGSVIPAHVPGVPGLYAWWAASDLLPNLQYLPDRGRHPAKPDLVLLYVGIAQDLRKRISGKHLGSSTGGSTLRRTFAALQSQQLGLVACWSPNGDRVTLEKQSEARLTAWMRQVLHVSWVPHPQPRTIEAEVIGLLGPACNVDHNEHHPSHRQMIAARAAWRASAGPSPVRG